MDTLKGGEGCRNHFMVEKSPSKLHQQGVMWPTSARLCHRGEDWGGSGENQGDSKHTASNWSIFPLLTIIRSSFCVNLGPPIHTPLFISSLCLTLTILLLGEEEHEESPCHSQASPPLQGEYVFPACVIMKMRLWQTFCTLHDSKSDCVHNALRSERSRDRFHAHHTFFLF